MKHRVYPLSLLLAIVVVAALPLLAPPSARATITEQRARLPPPAQCEDPVEGVWKAHVFRPSRSYWECWYLEIHKVRGSEADLVGVIRNHSWEGGPEEEEPGQCQGRDQWIVSTDGRGTILGDRIVFGGVGQWRLDQVLCGRGPWGYNLDNFSGTIDRQIMEFQSVNNDGGIAVNDPTVFRRIRCFEPDSQPHVQVTPPPFFPERESTGCGGLAR